MRATRWIVLGPVLAFTLLLAAACNGDGPAAAPPPASEGTASMVDPGQSRAAMPALNTAQPSGIAVSGTGMVFAEPDRAVVTLGVEARAETVSTARADAARAMTAIIAALGADGIAEQDIQTRSFDISPQYSRRERTDSSGARYNEQVLLGFIVSNQAAVNVRNMENIGGILDRVAEAGGDLTRIRGISFSSDDPTQLHAQAREAAVKDLMAKAQHYATLANVELGRIVYLSETGPTPAVRANLPMAQAAFASSAPASPISGGQLSVQVTVQGVFAIQ